MAVFIMVLTKKMMRESIVESVRVVCGVRECCSDTETCCKISSVFGLHGMRVNESEQGVLIVG